MSEAECSAAADGSEPVHQPVGVDAAKGTAPGADALAAGPRPAAILADILMASFAQQPRASQLFLGESDARKADGGGDGVRLLECILERLIEEVHEGVARCSDAKSDGSLPPASPPRSGSVLSFGTGGAGHAAKGPSAALVLMRAAFWDLLSQASLCMSCEEPAARAILLCTSLLLERACDALRYVASVGGGASLEHTLKHTFLSMLPLVASGLTLFSSFTSAFGARLLQRLLHVQESLRGLQERDAQERLAAVDRQDDFDLSQPGVRVETAHPFTNLCSGEYKLSTASSCLWLLFDPRSSLADGEAELELWVDGRMVRCLSGPAGSWPREPIVLGSGCAALQLVAKRAGRHTSWGFACRAHGFEPCFGPSLPLLLDAQKGLAWLAGRYAADLILGDPLSPEERAHSGALDRAAADGAEELPLPLPAALRQALLDRRARRAASRISGLEALLELLRSTTLPSVQDPVLAHLADALCRLQAGARQSLAGAGSSHFWHGCSGCGVANAERLRLVVEQLFAFLCTALRGELCTATPRPDRVNLLARAFMFRFGVADHPLLTACNVLELLRQVRGAPPKGVRRVCKLLGEHLVLVCFAGTQVGPPTVWQQAVLQLMQGEAERGSLSSAQPASSARAHTMLEQEMHALLSLLLSLCAQPVVCQALCRPAWVLVLLRLLREGSPRVAAAVLRILRSALPEEPLASLAAAIDQLFPSPGSLAMLLLQAVGRECCGDAPLVATGRSRRGHPAGLVNELVALARTLQQNKGVAWAEMLGQAVAAALEPVGALADVLSGSASAAPPAPEEVWAGVGALAVLGGHSDSLHVGGQVRASVDGSHGAAVVLSLGPSTAVVSADSAAADAHEAETASLEPVAEVLALAGSLELDALLGACSKLMPETVERSPLLALMQSKALKAVHALLASVGAAEVAAQLLHRGLFPPLLRAAALPVPVQSGPDVGALEQQVLLTDTALAECGESRVLCAGAESCSVPGVRLALLLPEALTQQEKLLRVREFGFSAAQAAEALAACEDDADAALCQLASASAERASSDEADVVPPRPEDEMSETLSQMGFPLEACVRALEITGRDMQASAFCLSFSVSVSVSFSPLLPPSPFLLWGSGVTRCVAEGCGLPSRAPGPV